MDNPFLSGPKQFNQSWRSLRDQLTTDKTDVEQLQTVINYWASAPTVGQFLDWANPSTWPDPWELMSSRNFDASALSLGMQYTLLLGIDGRWTPDRLRLALVVLSDRSSQYITLIVDNHYLLNFRYKTVVELNSVSNEFAIQHYYTYTNKTHKIE